MTEPAQIRRCWYSDCPHPVFRDKSDCIFHNQNLQSDEEDVYKTKFAELIHEWVTERKELWNFEGFHFPRGTDFSGLEYPKEVSFRNAHFRGKVSFVNVTFSIVDWTEAEFAGGVRFEQTTILDRSTWRGIKSRGPLEFIRCDFKSRIGISDASISELSMGDDTEFRSSFTVIRSEFSGDVSLDNVSFDSSFAIAACHLGADLFVSDTLFSGQTTISECTHRGTVFMEDNEFRRRFACLNSRFGERVEITRCKIAEGVDLSYASFSSVCLISSCDLTNNVKLRWPGDGSAPPDPQSQGTHTDRGTLIIEKPTFADDGWLNIGDNRFPSDCKLVLKGCDMSRLLLSGAEVACVDFVDSRNWPTRGGRSVVSDESAMDGDESPDDLWKLATTYQGLVENFGRRDFRLANEFQAGVYECRRRAARKLLPRRGWNEFIWMTLYRWGSNYSTSLNRPLLWILLLLTMFPFAYWSTSWRPEVDPLFMNAFNVSLQVSTLIGAGKEIARDNSFGFNLLVVLQVVLTFACVSLFLLALRKTFRHR